MLTLLRFDSTIRSTIDYHNLLNGFLRSDGSQIDTTIDHPNCMDLTPTNHAVQLVL
eukprot:jgi/Psemu1/314561/fgenesh1_kg.1599_\